ncbi:MAG: hypothetical protein HW416_58 [Chloroflexi bacterium]|nr:hypothetical protein [Chloroflexota bacterium]
MSLRSPDKSMRPFTPLRTGLNLRANRALDVAQVGVARHWLALANMGLAAVIVLSIVAPLLGSVGLVAEASPIYQAYYAICHQWPFRAFFLFGPSATYDAQAIAAIAGPAEIWTFVGNDATGFKMALCERDLAIFASALLMGSVYSRLRPRLSPPSVLLYLLLLIPIALDGFTQLPSWRESTWELRVSTGAITGIATVWLLFPYLDILANQTILASVGWEHAAPDS